jgi:tRNA(fMet)-specific endonuclease VapC
MKYLIDTNICIYVMNQRPPKVIRRFRQFEPGELVLSIITVCELWYGVAKSMHRGKNQRRLEEFLIPFEILSFDETAAKAYGHLRVQLEKSAQPIGPLDLLIAAHALSRNLALVTNNEKEFRRIEGLKVENWSK